MTARLDRTLWRWWAPIVAAVGLVCVVIAGVDTPARAQDAQPPAPVGVELPRLAAEQDTVSVIVAAPAGFTWPGLERFGDGRYLRGTIPADQVDDLRATPGVTWVEADLPLETGGDPANAQVNADDLDAFTFDGTNRTVAVIDNGVDFTHPALAGKNRGEACFEQTATCPGGTTSSAAPGSAYPTNGSSHGTFVAGLIGSVDPAVTGAADEAGIYGVRVFGTTGTAATSDVIAAMQHVRAVAPSHAAAGRPVVAVNMSLGFSGPFGPCPGGPTASEIAALTAAGIHVVVSSGNDGFTNGTSFPACVPEAFTVGAVVGEHVSGGVGDGAQDDTLAGFSNQGATVDVVAPGCGTSLFVGGLFTAGCGTSFSTPVVAALFADLSDGRPGSTRAQREAAIAKSGPFIPDHRVAGGGYGRFRADGLDALARLDENLNRDPDGFTAITPARAFASGSGMAGGPGANAGIGAGPLTAGDWFVDVAGPLGLSPGDVEAVAVNVTAFDAASGGWVSVFPDGSAWPGTSMLNYGAGQAIADAQYVPTGPGGGVVVRLSGGAAKVIVDVAGYWGPGSDYEPLTPARIMAVSMTPGETRFLDPRGQGGVPSSGVEAVTASTATVAYGNAGYVAVVPSDQPVTTSVQNFDTSEILAAFTVAKLGPDGRVKVHNGTNGNIDFYLDVTGYVPSGGADLAPAAPPGRIVDTRTCQGACGPLGAGTWTPIDLTWCGCAAAVVNLTAVGPSSAGHASMLPGPAVPANPGTSNLNVNAGGVLANLVTVGVGSDGYARLFTAMNSHYLVDFVGYTL